MRSPAVGLVVALGVWALLGLGHASAQSNDEIDSSPAQPPVLFNPYIDPNITVTGSVSCEEPTKVAFTVVPNFTPIGLPTITVTPGGTPIPVGGLVGSVNLPAAAGDNPTITAVLDGISASAGVTGLPVTCGDSNPPDPSLDVSAFSPICVDDVPYIRYSIKPIGFTPTTGGATLTIFDKSTPPQQVAVVKVSSLSGSFLYPGATVDENGKGTDWPGWKKNEAGTWEEDGSDSILRKGLDIVVQVNPTASTTVGYPDATPQCAGPQQAPPTAPPGELPKTGSGTTAPLQVGAALLVAGLIVLIAARRRPRAVA